jgi:alpha-D-ribose 1-methylphosphonate 5-triphosphate synthase subunit PhnI
MAYVAVKGGEKAIGNAHRWLAEDRRGDPKVPEIEVAQIREQLSLAVDRVMAEGCCHDRDLAALAIKQAGGDLPEAIFLIRAYRTTLPRFGASLPVETGQMAVRRRISAAFKDIPGGQVLGPTFDYTHRLLDFTLAAEGETGVEGAVLADEPQAYPMASMTEVLAREDLLEGEARADGPPEPFDLTREPLAFPAGRDQRLQMLARGDEGFLLGLAYSTQRGWGATNHPLCAEIRLGEVAVEFTPDELGFPIEIGEVTLTECQMVSTSRGDAETPARFARGYGLTFGHCERKAMAMAIVDRALRDGEAAETLAPAQDEAFVLSHCDNVEASGFVQHLKLPHHVDFQADLQMVRRLRAERAARDGALKAAAE